MISILGFEIRRKRKFGYEYWIKLSDIKISEDFKKHMPSQRKYNQKKDWYLKHGVFQSNILLGADFLLKDGFTSYLIAKEMNMIKVPVYFE